MKDKTHLLIVPDGALNFLPFETLLDEQGHPVLTHTLDVETSSGGEVGDAGQTLGRAPRVDAERVGLALGPYQLTSGAAANLPYDCSPVSRPVPSRWGFGGGTIHCLDSRFRRNDGSRRSPVVPAAFPISRDLRFVPTSCVLDYGGD